MIRADTAVNSSKLSNSKVDRYNICVHQTRIDNIIIRRQWVFIVVIIFCHRLYYIMHSTHCCILSHDILLTVIRHIYYNIKISGFVLRIIYSYTYRCNRCMHAYTAVRRDVYNYRLHVRRQVGASIILCCCYELIYRISFRAFTPLSPNSGGSRILFLGGGPNIFYISTYLYKNTYINIMEFQGILLYGPLLKSATVADLITV